MITLIKKEISSVLVNSRVIVEDTRGDSYHLALTVVSDEFKGKSRLERHRIIHNILGNKVGNEIHALTMSLLTEEEAKLV